MSTWPGLPRLSRAHCGSVPLKRHRHQRTLRGEGTCDALHADAQRAMPHSPRRRVKHAWLRAACELPSKGVAQCTPPFPAGAGAKLQACGAQRLTRRVPTRCPAAVRSSELSSGELDSLGMGRALPPHRLFSRPTGRRLDVARRSARLPTAPSRRRRASRSAWRSAMLPAAGLARPPRRTVPPPRRHAPGGADAVELACLSARQRDAPCGVTSTPGACAARPPPAAPGAKQPCCPSPPRGASRPCAIELDCI